MKDVREIAFIEEILQKSGELVMRSFGSHVASKRKAEKSQLVTELDIASERLLLSFIEKSYPQSSLIAEESGFVKKQLDDAWIIDPIDGTSNFANGLPWFGIMVAHVLMGRVFSSGIYLPASGEMYVAEEGKGAFKNGKVLQNPPLEDLSLCLVGFGADTAEKSMPISQKGKIYSAILPNVLNIRSTNSALDYVYAVEGKLGGLLNLENRMWDIAPILTIAKESGCVATDIYGQQVHFTIDEGSFSKNYTLLLGSPKIHSRLQDIISSVS